MPGIRSQTDREIPHTSAGVNLFKFIAQQNFVGMQQVLAESKGGLEQLDENSNTPFLYACFLGQYRFVRHLHKCGANIMRINVFGNILFGVFLRRCNSTPSDTHTSSSISFVTAPLTGQNALALAAYSGDHKTCEFLLRLRSYESFNGNSICSPLCAAVITKNTALVKYLMRFESAGSKIVCQSPSIHGVCPLKLAMLTYHEEITEALCTSHNNHLNSQQRDTQN